MKDKIGQPRTYDEDGFRQRAACICFKDDTEQEILLITSSRASNKWVIPGGGIEPLEDPGSAATREVWEEAGVKGQIVRFFGVFQNNERKHRTAVFELIVEEIADDWEESRVMGRRRHWFSIEDAIVVLSKHKPLQQSYLKLFSKLKQEHLLAVQIPMLTTAEESSSPAKDSPDTTAESSFASEAASSVSAALYSYLPFARRRDGRLYTMAKNSYYAYAPAHSPEMAWTAIAAVVSSIYDGQGSLTNVEAEISAAPKSGEVVRPPLATSTSEED